MATSVLLRPAIPVGLQARRFFRRPGAWNVVGGGIVIGAVAVVGVLAPWISPYAPTEQDLTATLLPPMWAPGGVAEYPLGTDAVGRDMLSRLMYGTRISLLVGLATAVGAAAIGVVLGVISGYLGGKIDALLQRVVEVFQAFPFVLLAILLVAVTGPGTWKIILVLVLSRWTSFCRVARAEAMAVREREYVLAAESMGASRFRIMLRHVLPSVTAPTIVLMTFAVSAAILGEASLSFIGIGVDPQTATWGIMLSDGRNYMYADPWLMVPPGLALFIVVLSTNILGDGLRDLTDPRMRNRR